MEIQEEEKLSVPTDFTNGNAQNNLVPPSHFASTLYSGGVHRSTGGKMPGTTSPINWTKPSLTSLPLAPDQNYGNYGLTISQTQQEIFKLKKDNQKLKMQLSEKRDYSGRPMEKSELWASQWRLEEDNYKAEAEQLKGQIQILKESATVHREEIRDKDILLNRQSHELEVALEELHKTKAELCLVREELSQTQVLKDKLCSQFENFKINSSEEMQKLSRDLKICREEAMDLRVKADRCRQHAEEAIKQQSQRFSEQLEELKRSQQVEVQTLTSSHNAELQEILRENHELQGRHQIISSEMLQLKGRLTEESSEKDQLQHNLCQMRQTFETQSATLHSLRNYIGQLVPESAEKDRLNEAVERLNKEKAALQMTAELLTIRLNSLNEILSLQEDKIIKKNSTDSIVKNGSVHLLQLWREKVFKLCVQLRSKDIELKEEKNELLSRVKGLEWQVQEEQHRVCVLQHSLEDKTAALDLERVEKETLKQNLAQSQKENVQLQLQTEKDKKDLKYLSEAMHRFSLIFTEKVSIIEVAQDKLNVGLQRVTFAKRQVETIQGLILRRAALQKVQQSTKQAEPSTDRIRSLQTELRLVSEERDKLTLELKRTPGLIEKVLSDLKAQYESRLMQKNQALEQSLQDTQEAVSERDQAQKRLDLIQDQLQQTEVKLEHLSCELLSQQESSQSALEERVSEIEECCAAKLKDMEDQVNRARAEHTRAVMTLRHFERLAAKKKEHLPKTHAHTEPVVPVTDLINRLAVQHSAAVREQREATSQMPSLMPKGHLPGDERLLCVLEELQSLSAAVVDSSEDSAEEEHAAQDNDIKD
ncbi:unnamed protein product [Knipowitschia caucasica]|uniref:Coiled-coil alpha-helical rod protein 1 n=1 Tax=Knipowitschia caucasica TaxID=637954 RepID=A0AAV2JD45_KNICA